MTRPPRTLFDPVMVVWMVPCLNKLEKLLVLLVGYWVLVCQEYHVLCMFYQLPWASPGHASNPSESVPRLSSHSGCDGEVLGLFCKAANLIYAIPSCQVFLD